MERKFWDDPKILMSIIVQSEECGQKNRFESNRTPFRDTGTALTLKDILCFMLKVLPSTNLHPVQTKIHRCLYQYKHTDV